MNRNKLYILLSASCIAGYAWLGLNYYHTVKDSIMPAGCLFKHATGIPCPSCGTTRAILCLLKGDFGTSFYLNPVGIVLAIIMTSAPLWIIYDLASRKSTLFSFYSSVELLLKQKPLAIAAIVLVAVNWIWNISKGL